MSKINKVAIGKKLRELRIERGLTCEYLAQKLGFCGRTKICQYERGRYLSINLIEKFCKFYNYSFDNIMKNANSNEAQDNDFSLLLKKGLREMKIHKKELQEVTGICIETINSWLNGYSLPSDNNCANLCGHLHIDFTTMWKAVSIARKNRFKN